MKLKSKLTEVMYFCAKVKMNDGMRHKSQFGSQLQQVQWYLGAITTATVCVFVLICLRETRYTSSKINKCAASPRMNARDQREHEQLSENSYTNMPTWASHLSYLDHIQKLTPKQSFNLLLLMFVCLCVPSSKIYTLQQLSCVTKMHKNAELVLSNVVRMTCCAWSVRVSICECLCTGVHLCKHSVSSSGFTKTIMKKGLRRVDQNKSRTFDETEKRTNRGHVFLRQGQNERRNAS